MSFGDKLVLGDGIQVGLQGVCQHKKLLAAAMLADMVAGHPVKSSTRFLCSECNEWITLPECEVKSVQQEGTANAQ
jgi:hypothetical protein